MNEQEQNRQTASFMALWQAWTIPNVAVTAIAIASLWVPRLWLPIVALVIGGLLYYQVRKNREAALPRWFVVPYITIYVLIIGGLVMALIDLWYSPGLFHGKPGHTLTDGAVSYLGALILFPLSALFGGWGAYTRYKFRFCVECRMRLGNPAERGFLGQIYCQEGLFQRRLLFSISTFESIVCWAYYIWLYDPASISSTDVWFFAVFPAVMLVITLICLAIRYFTLWLYYTRDFEGSALRHGASTTVRFIIIAGNEIFLNEPDTAAELMPTEELVDTPARITIGYRRHVTCADAADWFANICGLPRLEGIEVRRMYESVSASAQCNIFHFFAFADSHEIIEKSSLRGSWYTIYDIKDLIDNGKCSRLLAAEIYRLYTIAMAWKTYDRYGNRLYKIKHYTPTFRVGDIKKWDVDYNDPHWFYVSMNNADKPFFRFRRFWRRYISGIYD